MRKILLFFLVTNFCCNLVSGQSTEFMNKADSLINLMTLEEKVAMLHGFELFASRGVPRLGIPDLLYADGPLGVREEQQKDRFASAGRTDDSATFFPAGGALAATWNPELAYRYGAAMGQEARARNKDILLAPAVNIIRTPLGGRNYEYMSEDPFLASEMVVPQIKGIQDQDVAACVKHFALNNQETDRSSVSVEADERTVREIYLPAFKASVEEAGVLSVMGAYNRFRGEYLCENGYMLNDILKGEWGFKGVVVSDWNATHSTVKSALNGLDIEMGSRTTGGYDQYYFANPLLDSIREGKVGMSVIDEKIRRILYLMYQCDFFSKEREQGSINTPEITKVAYDVASEAIVLLKNEKEILPLNLKKIRKIAVIGHNATRTHASGGFGAGVKARYEITPLQGLQNRLPEKVSVNYAKGYEPRYDRIEVPGSRWPKFVPVNTPDSALISQAVEAARNSDVAIVFAGSNREYESESRDRNDMKLPFGQYELIQAVQKANPNTVVVVIGGSPYEIGDIEKQVSSIIWSWFNGSEGGNALADVLLGNINPSGKMPFTIPVKLEDSPAHALNAFPGENGKVEYKEGILVGYRWFDTKNIAPLFCFGHGLSYTSFIISDLKVNKDSYGKDETMQLSMKIKNIGKTAGAEVIQIYVKNTGSNELHPEKELKAFKKIKLKPGESGNISMDIPVKDLAWFDTESGSWKINEGSYTVYAGSSSRNLLMKTEAIVK